MKYLLLNIDRTQDFPVEAVTYLKDSEALIEHLAEGWDDAEDVAAQLLARDLGGWYEDKRTVLQLIHLPEHFHAD
jgi:hypothetical protein